MPLYTCTYPLILPQSAQGLSELHILLFLTGLGLETDQGGGDLMQVTWALSNSCYSCIAIDSFRSTCISSPRIRSTSLYPVLPNLSPYHRLPTPVLMLYVAPPQPQQSRTQVPNILKERISKMLGATIAATRN